MAEAFLFMMIRVQTKGPAFARPSLFYFFTELLFYFCTTNPALAGPLGVATSRI